jgi:hypothetical protein
VIDEIHSILEPETAGDPMSDRKWTHATAENVAECLGKRGIQVSPSVVLQAEFADKFGIAITVAHYPTGASKWNPVEHRLFSEISKNWAGEPLVTFHTLINFVRDTRTKTGLRVQALLDELVYKRGIKITESKMSQLSLRHHEVLGKWNYTILPRTKGLAVMPN